MFVVLISLLLSLLRKRFQKQERDEHPLDPFDLMGLSPSETCEKCSTALPPDDPHFLCSKCRERWIGVGFLPKEVLEYCIAQKLSLADTFAYLQAMARCDCGKIPKIHVDFEGGMHLDLVTCEFCELVKKGDRLQSLLLNEKSKFEIAAYLEAQKRVDGTRQFIANRKEEIANFVGFTWLLRIKPLHTKRSRSKWAGSKRSNKLNMKKRSLKQTLPTVKEDEESKCVCVRVCAGAGAPASE